MYTPDVSSASIQPHCATSTPKITVTPPDSSKRGEQSPSEDTIDLETTTSVSNDLSEKEAHGLCTGSLSSRNCPHQSQSSTPHASNCSGKSHHSNYCINLRSSANNLYLFNESEV